MTTPTPASEKHHKEECECDQCRPTPASEKCWIKHGFGDQICIREKGHDGFCRCASERGPDGTITYSEWESRDGKFYRHVGYQTIYPANANR